MAKCIKCGIEIADGTVYCPNCGENQLPVIKDFPTASLPSEVEILKRIEEGQQENRRLLKSISSSTAILAAVVIIQVIVTLISIFK